MNASMHARSFVLLAAALAAVWSGQPAGRGLAAEGSQPANPPAEYSRLWGRAGELWTPGGRLGDFSHAGYHRGERPIPTLPPGISVKQFGARGDGETDDSQAFLDAIAKAPRGAIEIPPGRYKITQILEITRPGIVLRGAGPDQTVLFFPKPLHEVRPNMGATTGGRPTSNYSWSGGWIWLRGSFGSKKLADVLGTARRGDTSLRVSSAEQLKVGRSIEIFQADTPENTLARHLYDDDPGPMENLLGRTQASLVCRVVAVEGDRVRFDRPLRFDVRPEWKPELRSFDPTVSEVGVEELSFEFPVTPYGGHFTELGYNPVALSGVADCWVRNVRVVNPDSGPMVSGCFNTIQGLVHESSRPPDRTGCVGHHGIYLGGGDNLFTEFDIRARFIHDISVSRCAGNVISRGRGVDLCFDHHRRAPYRNLFTDIDAGAGTRLWHCGGGAALGKHCAGGGTFWNIRAARPLAYPPAAFGPPSMNLVGLSTTQPSVTEADGKWFEAIDPAALRPQNLHEAQRARRLGAEPNPRRVLILTGEDYAGHKWRETTPVLKAQLEKDARLRVDVVDDLTRLRAISLDDYAVVVMHFKNYDPEVPGPEGQRNLEGFVRAGGGLVLVHFACGAFQEWPEFVKLAGRVWNPKLRGHDPHGTFRVEMTDIDHPITRGLEAFEITDELYTCLDGDVPITLLATARSKVDGKDYPMAFVLRYGEGRVFHCPLGHDARALENDGAGELFRRGTAWAAGLEPAAGTSPRP
jgi:type 1 glutamine amidotransferase